MAASTKRKPQVMLEWCDEWSGRRFRLVRAPDEYSTGKRKTVYIVEEHDTDAIHGDAWTEERRFYPFSDVRPGEGCPDERLFEVMVGAAVEKLYRRRRRRRR